MTRFLPSLAALLLVATAVSGCAFGDRHVTLSYPPAADSDLPAPALTRAPRPDITIAVARFTDDRADKSVGEVRNGWGMHTADVWTDTDVTTWIARAIAHDLRAAGYTVRWATNDTAGERVQLTGEVLTTYCRALMQYEGDVSLFIQIFVDGRPALNRRISGRGSSGVNWGATGEGYGECLENALRAAVAQLAADLRRTVDVMPPERPVPPAPPAVSPAPAVAPAAAPSS